MTSSRPEGRNQGTSQVHRETFTNKELEIRIKLLIENKGNQRRPSWLKYNYVAREFQTRNVPDYFSLPVKGYLLHAVLMIREICEADVTLQFLVYARFKICIPQSPYHSLPSSVLISEPLRGKLYYLSHFADKKIEEQGAQVTQYHKTECRIRTQGL